ncbi:Autolysin [Fusarium subglutinans]|uniref:Autolysin n=1 Tax=Gibberella subglutinans TaxID=42677 RepID=A0A8H5Q8L2_GIBSU|nr:Autolysin [Fusarium subglutinans]KAF5611695.1 Autolysin [Fusarium subglutinans]
MQLKTLLVFTGNLLPVFGAATKSSKAPEPQQPGIVANCKSYYLVQKGETCSSVATKNKISLSDFEKWNPKTGTDCNALLANAYACVSVTPSTPAKKYSPTQAGIAKNCAKYALVGKTTTCKSIETQNKLSFADFYKWNPAVGKHCQGLKKGYYVCVGVEKAVTPTPTTPENVTGNKAPSPVQKGITKSCNEYHRVSKGDTCSAVALEFKIDLDEFYKWNPAVGSKCENLWANYYYCVSVAGQKAKTTPAPK